MKAIIYYFKFFMIIIYTMLLCKLFIKFPTWFFIGIFNTFLGNNATWWWYLVGYIVLELSLLLIGWAIALLCKLYEYIYINYFSIMLLIFSITTVTLYELYKIWDVFGASSWISIIMCVMSSYVFLRLAFQLCLVGIARMANCADLNNELCKKTKSGPKDKDRSKEFNNLLNGGYIEFTIGKDTKRYLQLGNGCVDDGNGYLVEVYSTKEMDEPPLEQGYKSEEDLEKFIKMKNDDEYYRKTRPDYAENAENAMLEDMINSLLTEGANANNSIKITNVIKEIDEIEKKGYKLTTEQFLLKHALIDREIAMIKKELER